MVGDFINAWYYVLAALSIVLLTGWVGQISLAQASLIGVGAFVTALATTRWHVPFPVSLLFGAGAEPGLEPHVKSDLPKRAVKCEMCKGLKGGAACVRACPTGAAIRVSPEEFVNFAEVGE